MDVPSVNKLLKQDEVYKFTLPEQYRKIALDELRESDETRQQALEQMRDWIVKNPAIKTCRMDASFLLRFLRVRKFNHLLACETLERFLAMKQFCPKWFGKLDTAESWVDEMVEDWPVLPLGYDQAGRMVLMIKIGNVNVERFTNVELVRMLMLVMEVYYEEEKVQIAGSVIIFEDSGVTMSHVAQWPITDVINLMKCVNHSFPNRIREIHIVNLPRYAASLVEMSISFLSAKLKGRVHCHRSVNDMTKMVEQSILPKEYGGDNSIDELKNQYRKQLAKYRELILVLEQMEVDDSKSTAMWKDNGCLENDLGVVGSFRKLNVD